MSLITSSRSLSWRKQGAAVVGTVTFMDGRRGNVVLVGPRENPKGAVAVVPGGEGEPPATHLLTDALNLLHPQQLTEVVCMQERAFGGFRLPAPVELDA